MAHQKSENTSKRTRSLRQVPEDDEFYASVNEQNVESSVNNRLPSKLLQRQCTVSTSHPSSELSDVLSASKSRVSASMSEDHSFHKTNEDWNDLQNVVIGLFQKKHLPENGLGLLLEKVRNLLNSKTGTFLYDYYQTRLLTRGMVILRENIRLKSGKELLIELAELWDYFYKSILPSLEAILLPLSIKFTIQSGGKTVRRSTLIGFRDVVLLKVKLEDVLSMCLEIPPSIRQMLLVLQTADDTYPPSKQQMQLERLMCKVVIPYLGYRGLYMGDDEPQIYSQINEEVVMRKETDSLGTRRVSRPLSVQTPQIASLNQLFLNAVRKGRTSNFN